MMRRSLLATILVGLTVAAGVLTAPASASPARRCQDGERIVHGGVNPLIVDGTHCTIDSVNVGDEGATISGNAHLIAIDSTFHGPLALNDHAVLQMTRSTVDGWIGGNGTNQQVTVLHSHVHGEFYGQGRPDVASSETVRDTIVDHDLGFSSRFTAHLFVTGDQIGENLVTRHTDAIIQDTTVGLGITSLNDQGLQLCNVNVMGAMSMDRYAGSRPAYIGTYADPNTTCDQPVVVLSDLDITNSTGPVYLGNVVVHGVLWCSGNATKPIVSRQVVVTGSRHGQCRLWRWLPAATAAESAAARLGQDGRHD